MSAVGLLSLTFNMLRCVPSTVNGLVGSPCNKGVSRVFNTTVQKHQFFGAQLSLKAKSFPYMTTGKTIALTRWTFLGKVMSLLFNMLSTMVITFLPKSKCLLISWLPSPSAVILEPPKISLSLSALFSHLFAMK